MTQNSLLIFSTTTITKIVIYTVLSLGYLVWLRKASKDKSKSGINFKRVYCPQCKTKQPIIRMPKNPEQILYGGTNCPKCQANINKYGEIIS